jgi:hypothetical protein
LALHEIAPEPEAEPEEEEEPQGDLPFGFGGLARSHAPSLPFGFGASSQGLAALSEAQARPLDADEQTDVGRAEQDALDHSDASIVEGPLEEKQEPISALPPVPTGAPDALPPIPEAEPVQAPVRDLDFASSLPEIPSLWMESGTDVRQAYGLPSTSSTPTVDVSAEATTASPSWPPFAVVAPEPALLDGLLREPTIEAFRALAGEEWAVARERVELLLATGIDGTSLRTAAGIACMEQGEQASQGLQHLKQAAKLSGGDLKTMHNLALAMAMDGRVEAVDRLLASVGHLPDEGGFVTRMNDARKMMKSSSA